MVTKRHFHTFDALRFFAFLKVFLLHVPVSYSPFLNYIKVGGGIGVQFFFVLSGFLITYIIAEEKQQTGRLDLKHFLARRVLRIWPVYYLMVGFAFFTPYILTVLGLESSNEGYTPEFFYTLTFLENYKSIIAGEGANVSPLPVMWSVCVEEHFYLLWGLLLYFVNIRHLPKIIVTCVVVAPLSRALFVHFGYGTYDLFTNIDLFAVGAVPAYFLIKGPRAFERTINAIHPLLKVFYILMVIGVVVITPHIEGAVADIVSPSVLALLFTGLLAIFLPENSAFRIGDKNILSRLGVYTYGMYLYHTVLIKLLLRIVGRFGWSLDRFDTAALFFLASLSLTTLVAVISYVVIERPFLRLKKYFY